MDAGVSGLRLVVGRVCSSHQVSNVDNAVSTAVANRFLRPEQHHGWGWREDWGPGGLVVQRACAVSKVNHRCGPRKHSMDGLIILTRPGGALGDDDVVSWLNALTSCATFQRSLLSPSLLVLTWSLGHQQPSLHG